MPAGLPTLSELRAATFDHLGAAASWWERIAGTAETQFAEIARHVRHPGGVAWEGAAADAAAQRAEMDLVKVRGAALDRQQAAAMARRGQDSLAAGKQNALDAVAGAQGDGFAVSEDYSVADTRPASSRAEQARRLTEAQAHSSFIRHRVANLVADDAGLAARLKAATAGFGTLVFPELDGGAALHPVDAPMPPAGPGGVTVCEPYTAGGGFMCFQWFLDGSADRSYWSRTDQGGAYWP